MMIKMNAVSKIIGVDLKSDMLVINGKELMGEVLKNHQVDSMGM